MQWVCGGGSENRRGCAIGVHLVRDEMRGRCVVGYVGVGVLGV